MSTAALQCHHHLKYRMLFIEHVLSRWTRRTRASHNGSRRNIVKLNHTRHCHSIWRWSYLPSLMLKYRIQWYVRIWMVLWRYRSLHWNKVCDWLMKPFVISNVDTLNKWRCERVIEWTGLRFDDVEWQWKNIASVESFTPSNEEWRKEFHPWTHY